MSKKEITLKETINKQYVELQEITSTGERVMAVKDSSTSKSIVIQCWRDGRNCKTSCAAFEIPEQQYICCNALPSRNTAGSRIIGKLAEKLEK